MKRYPARLPGQPLKPRYKGGAMKTSEGPDHNAEMAAGRWGASKYWQLRLDECDQFSEVKVYAADGVTLIRVLAKDNLKRPMPLKPGQGWNTILFPIVK